MRWEASGVCVGGGGVLPVASVWKDYTSKGVLDALEAVYGSGGKRVEKGVAVV